MSLLYLDLPRVQSNVVEAKSCSSPSLQNPTPRRTRRCAPLPSRPPSWGDFKMDLRLSRGQCLPPSRPYEGMGRGAAGGKPAAGDGRGFLPGGHFYIVCVPPISRPTIDYRVGHVVYCVHRQRGAIPRPQGFISGGNHQPNELPTGPTNRHPQEPTACFAVNDDAGPRRGFVQGGSAGPNVTSNDGFALTGCWQCHTKRVPLLSMVPSGQAGGRLFFATRRPGHSPDATRRDRGRSRLGSCCAYVSTSRRAEGVKRSYRLVYVGALRARLRPGFLRSFSRASRVSKPALRSAGR